MSPRPSLARRVLTALYGVSAVLAAINLVAICAIMLTQVAFRELGIQLRGADDLTAWACAGAAFLGLAHTFKRGELVRVGLYVGRLTGRSRWRVEVFALAVAVLFTGYLAFWLVHMVYESWQFNDMAQGLLRIPLWIPQAPVAFGAVALFLAVADEMAAVLAGRVPEYERAEQERRARGDFSAEV